jgi:hypothetical protein
MDLEFGYIVYPSLNDPSKHPNIHREDHQVQPDILQTSLAIHALVAPYTLLPFPGPQQFQIQDRDIPEELLTGVYYYKSEDTDFEGDEDGKPHERAVDDRY